MKRNETYCDKLLHRVHEHIRHDGEEEEFLFSQQLHHQL